jgi:tryptophanyl-tRNA synthetase
MVAELTPIRERAAELEADPVRVTEALERGAVKARAVASQTMADVKTRMGLSLA